MEGPARANHNSDFGQFEGPTPQAKSAILKHVFRPKSGLSIGLLIAAMIVSVVIHELMHGVMAYWLGDTTA